VSVEQNLSRDIRSPARPAESDPQAGKTDKPFAPVSNVRRVCLQIKELEWRLQTKGMVRELSRCRGWCRRHAAGSLAGSADRTTAVGRPAQRVLVDLGRWEEAAASVRTALRLQPDLPDAFCDLGDILYRLGRSAEAQRSYRAALCLRPEHPELHMSLGVTLLLAGQFKEGWSFKRNASRRLVSASSKRPRFRNALPRLLSSCGTSRLIASARS
jgi:tetratricopeptide (TPR) repeat protein